jgi:hypothetical protein
MQSDDLDVLEAQLRVELPLAYKKFLLAYPTRLSELRRDMGWKQESPADRELLNDPWQLLKDNHCVRMPRTPWTDNHGPWPDRYFVIGNNECGDYWALDLSEPSTRVYFYDHERGIFAMQSDSVQDFADWLADDVENWNQRRQEKNA